MGGGGDSRIPRLLRERFAGTDVRCIVRTYDFDPETGRAQIAAWVDELRPDLVIGESLGAIQAMRIGGVPHLYVSPSLGAPRFLYRLAWLCRVPGGPALLHRLWPVKEGDRQPLKFEYDILKKYKAHWEEACRVASEGGYCHAFFGTRDHYRKWGVVRISAWRERFGDTYTVYEGTHFMEEEYVDSLLVPKIREVLDGAPDILPGD
jgi:hypothetical protein